MAKIDQEIDVLAGRRRARNRQPGDGQGRDVGIAPGGYSVTVAKHIDALADETRQRLLQHVRGHVDEALKPLVRLMERAGCSEYEIHLFRDVGPNAMRTLIEHLEEVND